MWPPFAGRPTELNQSSPPSNAIGHLQLIDQFACLSDAEIFGMVESVALLQGDSQVEALPAGDGMDGPNLTGGGLALAVAIRGGMAIGVAV